MTPNQPLIYFLSILPEFEYEVEKRTFCDGLLSYHKQVLLTIHSRFEDLQSQRKKGGERKDAGHAFVVNARGRSGGKTLFLVRRTRSWEGTRGVVVRRAQEPQGRRG